MKYKFGDRVLSMSPAAYKAHGRVVDTYPTPDAEALDALWAQNHYKIYIRETRRVAFVAERDLFPLGELSEALFL